MWCSFPFWGLSVFSKYRRVFARPVASSNSLAALMRFCLGIFSLAASSRSAAFSDFFTYFASSGSVRSSSLNCRREACGCVAAFAACFASFLAFLRRFFALCRCLSVSARFRAFPVMFSAVSPEKSSVSLWLLRVCSPVAWFVSTTPSRVIFCVLFAFALNSCMNGYPPFRVSPPYGRGVSYPVTSSSGRVVIMW